MLAVTAASAAMSAYGAKRQYDAQKAAYGENSALIQQQYNQDMMDMRAAQEIVQGDAANEMSERVLGMRSDLSTIRTIAGEYAAGNNSLRLANAAEMQATQDLNTIQQNRDRQLSEIGKDANAARTRKARELASLQKPDRLGRNLAIAGSALEVASAYNKFRTPAPAKTMASWGVVDESMWKK